MTTALFGCFFIFGFVLLCWYLETCDEIYQKYKASKQNKQDRENARYIQKVDRYYHEV